MGGLYIFQTGPPNWHKGGGGGVKKRAERLFLRLARISKNDKREDDNNISPAGPFDLLRIENVNADAPFEDDKPSSSPLSQFGIEVGFYGISVPGDLFLLPLHIAGY